MIYLIHHQDNSYPDVILFFDNLAIVREKYKNSLNDPGYHLYESFIKSMTSFR